jgi:hypothetical protein
MTNAGVHLTESPRETVPALPATTGAGLAPAVPSFSSTPKLKPGGAEPTLIVPTVIGVRPKPK